MLELIDVRKRFGDHTALDGVTLALEPGRTAALIGPSGCGKSTALRAMIGLVRPDSGEVRFDGRCLGELDLAAVRRHLGYVIQAGGLFPHLSARHNAELPARHLGPRRGWDRARVAERLRALVALTRFPEAALDHYPAELSGGQIQRVSLMRALFLDPDVLLLDEPLAALDPLTRSELQAELREIFAALGKTALLVTHDLAEAAYLAAADIVLMRRGRVIQRASFDALCRAPADDFVRRFIAAQTQRVEALLRGGVS